MEIRVFIEDIVEKPDLTHSFFGYYNQNTGAIESSDGDELSLCLDGQQVSQFCEPNAYYKAQVVFRDNHNPTNNLQDAYIVGLFKYVHSTNPFSLFKNMKQEQVYEFEIKREK